jgi:hypothetical protein
MTGIHLYLKNGITVSIQNGPGTYCDEYSVEMAAWRTTAYSFWLELSINDTIRGFIPVEKIGKMIDALSSITTEELDKMEDLDADRKVIVDLEEE